MKPVILAPTDRLSRHYARRVQQILARFNDIRELIEHQGIKGERVEGAVKRFLLDFLPDRYTYRSGIVIDSSGGESDRSRQEDILVIDRFFNPRLFLDEELPIYPVEVVYCGIEVKTSIDGEGLRQAVENIASLKRLRPVTEKFHYVQDGNLVTSETSGPLGFIFSFDTTIKSADTLLENFARCLNDVEPEAWPNFVCILNRGLMGITAEDEKAQFRLYGLLGRDEESGRINALEVAAGPTVDEFEMGGQRYPIMTMRGKRHVVDVARTFVAFLGTLYDMLLSKVMISHSSLLQSYIPKEMTHYLYENYKGEVRGVRREAAAEPDES